MKTTFIASGDSFATRRIPQNYPGGRELRELIRSHDVCFNNLEITCHEEEGYPAAFSGGTWAMTDPVLLDDLGEMGFNLFNTANNHACDFCHGGLLATARHLRERAMVFAGTGKNLTEASRAAYLDTGSYRVALIAATSDFHDSDLAGEQSPQLLGRPGVNGLRVDTVYHVTSDYFTMLKKLVQETNMNAYQEYGVKLGYVSPLPEDILSVNGMKFQKSECSRIETRPHTRDLKRILSEVQEARRQADYVMVSIHTHDGHPDHYINPPEFMESFAHACIDAGADAILGHGPHELRAVEIYKGKPIFYSLGNFIFQTETVAKQPADAFENKGLPVTTKVGEYMDARSSHGTRGYGILPPVWFSVLPSWTWEDGRVKEIRLYPISLGQQLPRSQKGLPRLSSDPEILRHLQELSKLYQTQIKIRDGIGIIDSLQTMES